MGDRARADGGSTVLAAGTVGGAGTTVALRAALEALAADRRQLEVIAPGPLVAMVQRVAPNAHVTAVGRVRAVFGELMGRGRAQVYIGFADRLPLIGRGGAEQVLVVQNPHLYEPTDVSDGLAARAKFACLRRWARHSVRRADRVICSSSSSADAVSAACGVARSSIDVRPIPPPQVGAPKVEHRDRIERVLLVGDVYPYKRWEVAVDAAAAFAEIDGRAVTVEHLGMVRDAGAGQRFGASIERAAAVGVTVQRRGAVSHDEVLAAMRDADVLMLTSEAESQGLPLAEAMVIGLPVVARDLPVFREQAMDAAVLVAGGVDEFVDALDSLDDREARVRASSAGRPPRPADGDADQRADGWRLLD